MLMLILGSALQAQSFSFTCFQSGNYNDLITLQDYVDAFVEDAGALGHTVEFADFQYAWEGDQNQVATGPILSDSDLLYPNVTNNDGENYQIIAQGAIACSSGSDIIRVSRTWWNDESVTKADKLRVVYHELGHSYVRLDHTQGQCKIMTVGSPISCFETNSEMNDAWFSAIGDLLDQVNQISACKSTKLKIIDN